MFSDHYNETMFEDRVNLTTNGFVPPIQAALELLGDLCGVQMDELWEKSHLSPALLEDGCHITVDSLLNAASGLDHTGATTRWPQNLFSGLRS
jgi:hypothetical protein